MLCDKDGISAAAIFLEMANFIKQTHQCTVLQHFQSLEQKYGVFVSHNSYFLNHDQSVTESIFLRLRSGGPTGGYWDECNGVPIITVKDVTKGYDSSASDKRLTLPLTPDSQMIMYVFANGVTATLRTSGTEPKIKYYTEIAGSPGQLKSQLDTVLKSFVDGMLKEMLQPELNGLLPA
jgi:phosphomannomutase